MMGARVATERAAPTAALAEGRTVLLELVLDGRAVQLRAVVRSVRAEGEGELYGLRFDEAQTSALAALALAGSWTSGAGQVIADEEEPATILALGELEPA